MLILLLVSFEFFFDGGYLQRKFGQLAFKFAQAAFTRDKAGRFAQRPGGKRTVLSEQLRRPMLQTDSPDARPSERSMAVSSESTTIVLPRICQKQRGVFGVIFQKFDKTADYAGILRQIG